MAGGRQRKLRATIPHAQARLVVADCILGPTVKGEVAEMRMRIQAAEIGLAEVHQLLDRGREVTSVLEIVGLADRVVVGFSRVPTWAAPVPSRTSAEGRGQSSALPTPPRGSPSSPQ